jgi:hypothetical protein
MAAAEGLPRPEVPLVDVAARLAFISHSHVDRSIANELKGLLRPLGLTGFVAHEDIEPNAEWRVEILRNLRSCHGLVVIATDDARTSFWVNQEIGAAVVRGVGTVTVNCGAAPFGFVDSFQAARWTPKAAPGDPWRDRNFLEGNLPVLCHALKRAGVVTQGHLIEGLGDAWSFEEARVVAKLIAESGSLEMPEAVRLAQLIDVTSTIRSCWEAQRLLPQLLRPHVNFIPPDLVERLSRGPFALHEPETEGPGSEPDVTAP